MPSPAIEDLVGLPEEQALRRYVDGANAERMRWIALGMAVLAFLALLAYLFASQWSRLAAPIGILVAARLIYVGTDGAAFRRFAQGLVPLSFLALCALAVFLPPNVVGTGLPAVGYLAPLLLASLCLRPLAATALIAAIWAATLGPGMLESLGGAGLHFGPREATQTGLSLACLYFSVLSSNRTRRSFQRRFRIESSRVRERQRMREELASARQIQLSMLPRADPRVDGFDVSAMSLPAAEVGGDYYEYFPDDGSFALAIGDVAGHGVASGLLLSGIRSCLYLLHPEHPDPRELFTRLDRMVRLTTERRMFITLLYAVFEPKLHELVYATAGHPPPLHYRAAERAAVVLDGSAPPLGTRLPSNFHAQSVSYRPGDVLLFFTDGVTETVNARGDLYTDDRLLQRFQKAAANKHDARAIREALLADLWTYKGDGEQLDDVTLIAVRVSG